MFFSRKRTFVPFICLILLLYAALVIYFTESPPEDVPELPLSLRYWERSGDQTIYDVNYMERLNFSTPDLQDNCTAIIRQHRRIPKIIHYVFGLKENFDKYDFGLVQYVAIKSAHEMIKPKKIILHFRYLPPDSNIWWQHAKQYVTEFHYLESDVTEVFGNPVRRVAHMADVVRMQELMKTGGIYLDFDVIVLKSFDKLLHHDFVLGQEADGEYVGLANALMIGHKDSLFLKRWWQHYVDFNDDDWSGLSVKLPYKLSLEFPEEICHLPRTSFFYPSYFFNHVDFVHKQDEFVFKKNGFQYAFHSSMQASISNESLTDVIARNTSYTRLMRMFLPEEILYEGRVQLEKEIQDGKRSYEGNLNFMKKLDLDRILLSENDN
ncbi:hypothetical protein HK096_011034 [Nowakowskiella sp. JEL0078]|nr:hypothetical protein HK096_011034 [Nowakowskiella sp. JEL0078]